MIYTFCFNQPLQSLNREVRTYKRNLVAGLPIQAGGGDVAGPVGAAGGEQDEVTWEGLVLPHHHDVPHLAADGGGTEDTHTQTKTHKHQ